MRVTVLGYKYAKGVGKKSNKSYEGFYVSMSYPENGTTGLKAVTQFFGCDMLQGLVPEVGMQLDIDVAMGTGYINSIRLVMPELNLNYGQPMKNPAPMNQNTAPASAPTEQPAQNQQNQKK